MASDLDDELPDNLACILEIGQTRLSRGSWPPARSQEGRVKDGKEEAGQKSRPGRRARSGEYPLPRENRPGFCPFLISSRNCNAPWKGSKGTPTGNIDEFIPMRTPPRGKRASNRGRDVDEMRVPGFERSTGDFQ